MGKKIFYRSRWVEFTGMPTTAFFKIRIGSYFDSRVQLSFSLTFVLAVIAMIMLAGGPWAWLFIPGLFTGWGRTYIDLPIYTKHKDEAFTPEYGFYLFDIHWHGWFDSLWICYGRKTKAIYMPWAWRWERTSIMLKDGSWEHEFRKGVKKAFWNEDFWNGLIWKESYQYMYVLKSGKIQQVTAKVHVEEREWRWRFGLPWPRMVERSISVGFDKEVGERTGSWKGGVTGCSYEMKEGESPIDTLRRMEKERKFN
jgi:hypothetical protein